MTVQNFPPLWKHQEAAIEKLKNLPSMALLLEPGTGKTRTTLEILRHKFVNVHGKILDTLIVCPLIVTYNWVDEFRKYTKIDPKNIILLTGSERHRMDTLVAREFQSGGKIVVVNYEGLLMKKLYDMLLNKFKPEVLIMDEMHKLKDYSAQRSKLVQKIARDSKYRMGLTGSALLNSPMDIFGQWLCVDNGSTFGTNFFVFRNTYFYDKNAGMPKHIHFPKFVPKVNALEAIQEKIKPITAIAKKNEVLDLPPFIKNTLTVELDTATRRIYNSLKKEFVAWLADNETSIVANTAHVKALRLMQITSGFYKNDEGEEVIIKDNPKAKALDELLDTLLPNGKVIIWACFIKNYEIIKRVLAAHKVKFVECHGEISSKDKFLAVDKFNIDPDVRVFIGHPQSLGVGINLTAARYSVYYSRNFSLENDIQSEARNYRGGSEIHDTIMRYDIVAKDTIDEACMVALEQKQHMGFTLLKNWVLKENNI